MARSWGGEGGPLKLRTAATVSTPCSRIASGHRRKPAPASSGDQTEASGNRRPACRCRRPERSLFIARLKITGRHPISAGREARPRRHPRSPDSNAVRVFPDGSSASRPASDSAALAGPWGGRRPLVVPRHPTPWRSPGGAIPGAAGARHRASGTEPAASANPSPASGGRAVAMTRLTRCHPWTRG
jgi:hypothetical protein